MANEIWHNYDEGNTLYFVIHRKSDDKVWESEGAWSVWVDANIDSYSESLTDHDGDYYTADFPVEANMTPGVYRVTIFLQVGANPHADDDLSIAQGEIAWDGTKEISTYELGLRLNMVLNVYDET